MPIRNPFARRPGALHDDSIPSREAPGFERVDTVGSKSSSGLSISTTRSHDTGEYKMSVVDSGVYLPPSPTEELGQWPRRYLSRTSTDTKSSVGDIEHFGISRESFDSYRRSFDITARAPIARYDSQTRASLDTYRFPQHSRQGLDYQRRMDYPPPTAEEPFEDVGLDDQKLNPQAIAQRKRGFFSKFSDGQDKDSVSRFLIPSRKRGQSGQGSELGHVDHPQHPKIMVTSDNQAVR